MSYRKRNRLPFAADQRGVTLIESLVAIALLALSAAAIGGLLTQQIRQAASNQLSTVAYGIAAEELENMRGLPYAAMSGGSHQQVLGDVVFVVSTEVLSNVPAANMKKVTVEVSWNEPQGARDVAMSTVYTAVQKS